MGLSVCRSGAYPERFVVEGRDVGNKGVCAQFSGGSAEELAREYAAFKNRQVEGGEVDELRSERNDLIIRLEDAKGELLDIARRITEAVNKPVLSYARHEASVP